MKVATKADRMANSYLNLSVLVFFFTQLCIIFVLSLPDKLSNDVKIDVLFMPEVCTEKSKRGDLLNAHYDGYLAEDHSQFYCSRSDKAGHPQWFVLGVGQVIKGLDIGMNGMCPGEKRKVTVPPDLAFGSKGKHPVPPNATLIFEVELFSVSRGPRSMESFKEIDLNKDRTLTKAEVIEYLKLEYQKGSDQHDDPFFDNILADIFRKSDHNGDGLISAKEYNVYEHDEL